MSFENFKPNLTYSCVPKVFLWNCFLNCKAEKWRSCLAIV